jgi:putative ABC transport system ATP-binding protein
MILETFCKLHDEGRTIMLVTHDPEIAALTPQKIEIRDGKIASEVDAKLSGQATRFQINRTSSASS